MFMFEVIMGSFYLHALSLMVVRGVINVRFAAFGEHVLHGEAASAHGERVPATLGVRASSRQGAAGARQLRHLHLH